MILYITISWKWTCLLESVGRFGIYIYIYIYIYAMNWCVLQWNGLDAMAVIIFFHITSGRINMWAGVNQLKELFFLNLIIFLIYISNWKIIGILLLKTHYFSQFITKGGGGVVVKFEVKMTLAESDQSTRNPLFTMTTSQRACKPVMTTRAFSRWNQHHAKALCWKSVGGKKVLVMLGYHSI